MTWHDILSKTSEEWSEFLHSREVDQLSNGKMSVKLLNICFDNLCREWVMKMAKKYAPNDMDNAIKALCKMYNIRYGKER